MKPRIAIAMGILLTLVALVYAHLSFNSQIDNSITLQRYSRELSLLYSNSGSLPASFAHDDHWGRPIIYLHDDQHFILASFGCDGKPDGIDLAALLTAREVSERASTCLFPWRDTVFVDGRAWSACLK